MIEEKLEQNDVVISSRIRLARNIAEYPFVSTCSDDQRAEIESTVRSGLNHDDQLTQLSLVDSLELDTLERQFLLALKLINVPKSVDGKLVLNPASLTTRDDGEPANCESVQTESDAPDLSSVKTARIDSHFSIDDICLTVNEEDHLRITVTRNDLDLATAWDQISQLDDRIEQHLNFAYSPRWGYLTACPANVGTGMRVSVLVHLPALVMTGQTEKVFRSLQRINVVARPAFGENVVGDFFRIGNQATLGVNESELIQQVADVVPLLVKFERQARELLVNENRAALRKEVNQALEQLCQWDFDDVSPGGTNRAMNLLSKVRLGAGVGLLTRDEVNRVNRRFALIQLRHQLLTAVAREDYQNASRLRDQIQSLEQGCWPEGGTT